MSASAGFCGRCGAPAEGAAFCRRCGLPLSTPAPPYFQAAPAYPTAWAPQPQRLAGRRGGALWVTGLLTVGVLATGAMTGLAAYLLVNPSAPSSCGTFCARPPTSPPLGEARTYTSSALGWSIQYPEPLRWNQEFGTRISLQDDHSIGWTLHWQNADWPVTFSGQRADNRDACQLVRSLQAARFPDSRAVYDIPGAELGYEPGCGTVFDLTIVNGAGASMHARAVIVAAVRRGVAVEEVSVGPYYNQAHGYPNPSANIFGHVFDPLANTVAWQGDPPV